MERFCQVDPGELHLPSGRQDGAVPDRYFRQVQAFGPSALGMPVIEVTEGLRGELMINDGVTRATRMHYLAPGQKVVVEVFDRRPGADFSRLKRVRDVPPPSI